MGDNKSGARVRSDFGFEMLHGSQSLSTEENASSCCHSNVQNKCDTVGERAGGRGNEAQNLINVSALMLCCALQKQTHKTQRPAEMANL